MIIRIDDTNSPVLDEANNFRGFKVVCSSARSACADKLAQIGRPDGDHVWVKADWLRANGPGDESWLNELGKMIDYAASAGWVDESGAIRAHIEDA